MMPNPAATTTSHPKRLGWPWVPYPSKTNPTAIKPTNANTSTPSARNRVTNLIRRSGMIMQTSAAKPARQNPKAKIAMNTSTGLPSVKLP